jgi:hypothetical protein
MVVDHERNGCMALSIIRIRIGIGMGRLVFQTFLAKFVVLPSHHERNRLIQLKLLRKHSLSLLTKILESAFFYFLFPILQ